MVLGLNFQFLQPKALLLFIPLATLVWYLIRKDFVNLPEDEVFQLKKKKWRRWITVSRIIIVLLLCIALAEPFTEVTREVSGNPRLTILIDNSTSMELFNQEFLPQFMEEIESRIPLKVKRVGTETSSPIGEGILANIEQDNNVLLITDGYNNQGTSLGDVSLFAQNTNSTVSALDLQPDKSDVAVSILGPEKVVESVNNTYLVKVTKPNVETYHLTVTVDDEVVFDRDTSQSVVRINQQFSDYGDHTLKAEVSTNGQDHFSENNVYRKTVRVVEKPNILYMTSKDSPLEKILNQLYEVDKRGAMPRNISDYYAIVVNDMKARSFNTNYDKLSDYLIDGNGMVVFGGFNSYDRGNYKNSVFEQLLPVKVGSAERDYSDNTIVLSIDRSKGGGKCRIVVDTVTNTKTEVCSEVAYTDVIKSQAVQVINQLDETNKVGAVAFDTGTYLIEPIEPLYEHKEEMINKIKKINPGGNTLVSKGIQGAYNLLSNKGGSRYVILLTDGVTYKGDRDKSVGLAGNLYQQGIKLITVGIGRSVYDGFLKDAASNGGGFYLSASDKGRLKVLFGEPEEGEEDDNYGIVVVNSGHFITQNTDPNAVMKGYNQVIPKSSAQLLATTDTGEPALTVWRYGLGKVASWNVFTGNTLGELLNAQNSKILTKTVNWAIGDPERKKNYFVDISDGRVNEPLKINVKADKIPSAEGLNFVKKDENQYEASLTPKEVGFGSVLNSQYAVNYPVEYQETGFNPELEGIVQSTGGNLFKPSETQRIVEFVKSVSKKTVTEKTVLVWPFLLGALLLFLIEVLLRRISENKMMKRR